MQEEIWKPVVGYEGLYMVSNIGRVKSLHYGKEKILKLHKDKFGYLKLGLYKDGKRTFFRVHRLVAQAFLPNQENLSEVNHKDECKTNNFVYVNKDGSVDFDKSNLELCTKKYNNSYGTRLERIRQLSINGNISKRVFQYTLDGEFVKEWPSIHEIERELGFSSGHICKCCNGKCKHRYGFIWKYAA